MENTTKPTSLRLTEARLTNLERIAKALGCERGGRGSIGVLLNKIADADLVVSKNGMQTPSIPPFVVQQAVQHPTEIPIQPPAWNAPVATSLKVSDLPKPDFSTYAMHPSPNKSAFVTDRGDGTFVDTEEFDKPVPQKRVPAVLPESGNVQVPSVSSNVEAMKNATKEQKIQAALAAMGSAIKKGSEL